MNTGRKLAAFALLLGVAFGGGAAVGKAAGPIDVGTDSDGGGDGMEQMHAPEADAPSAEEAPPVEAEHDHATSTSEPRAAEPQEQP